MPKLFTLLVSISIAIAGLVVTAPAATAADTDVKINEVESNGGTPGDWVEVTNTGASTVDISGWLIKDNDDTHVFTVPASTSLAAGAFLALDVEASFGLGGADSARLYAADGTTLIDSYSWTSHATTTYGRCPDGSGAFATTITSTKGVANSCTVDPTTVVRINEVESNGGTPGDWVEVTNTGASTVDISGWLIKDNDDTHVFTVPASTSLAAGAFLALDVEASFGLGGADSARLYAADGTTLIDSYSWTSHATTTYGRCPDGTGAFVTTAASTKGAANSCPAPATPDVVINEVESNGDQVADWVELKNRGGSPVDISGWKILDNDAGHVATPVVVPASTSIPAGGYYAIYTEIAQSPGFGLGVGDSVTLFLPDGTTQVDTTTWGAHAATTWGRCPDGTGTFRETTASTRGAANACSPIRINEIESSGGVPGDWVELVNISTSPVDVSGYVVKDNEDAHAYAIPASTSIAGKDYLVIDESALGFGLGGADSVRLYAADGTTLIEQYTWTTAATQSYARCKDGLGDFKDAKAPTKGAVNSCPGLETSPWPGGQTVTTADLAGTFVQDLSGLAFDPADPDVLWAAQNKLGTLFKLTRDGDDNFVPAAGWPKDPKYADGTGAPDTEGITIGPDGFVYLASERNNAASGISRMSILRYDPAATGSTITATREWDLTSQIPAAGANLGLEGVAFVPDTYLVGNGFQDQSTSATYDPALYPHHGSGLYFVAIEDTGDLIAFALDSGGTTSHRIATIDSGFEHLADVDFDAELGRVRAVTDDTHDGKTSLLKIDGTGAFVVDAAYDRPAGMPNLNNEGLAVASQSTCVAGKKEVVWADDGDTDGHSLRRGTIDCTPPQPQTVTFTSAPPSSPIVGGAWVVTAQGGGSGNPITLTASGCTVSGTTVTFTRTGTCTVEARQAGSPAYLEGSATRSVVVGKAPTTTTVTIGATQQRAAVAAVGVTPTGTVTFSADGTTLGTATLTGGVATLAQPLPSGVSTLTATYAGDANLLGSSGSDTRTAATITTALSPSRPASGWWTGPVTVTFTCSGGSGTVACPAPVTLTGDGADQSVSRTVTTSDGETTTARVGNIDIDGTGPKVRIKGATAAKAKCVASDALSGLDSCTISKSRKGKKVTVVARARDLAGNVSTDRVTYRVRRG